MIEKVTGGIFSSVSIEFTNTPKHEVSYGLLVDQQGSTDLNIKERSYETVLGEEVIVGKSKIEIVSPDLRYSGWISLVFNTFDDLISDWLKTFILEIILI